MNGYLPPVLPIELEREIFEIAARSYPQSIPKLMLVAWRVRTWVEPLLYRTIIFSPSRGDHYDAKLVKGDPLHSRDTLFLILKSKPPSFFRHVPLNLFLPIRELDDATLILSHCLGIENLWLNAPFKVLPHLFPLVADLPLKRFHSHLGPLFGSAAQIDFSHQFFAQITHLGLYDYAVGGRVDHEVWSKLSLIPHLTHLSFDPIFVGVCLTLLRTCPSLRVLVAIGLGSDIDHHPDRDALANDPRFVVMNSKWVARDWQIGTRTGGDHWSRAEDFIVKRKSGEVDIRQYRLLVDERQPKDGL